MKYKYIVLVLKSEKQQDTTLQDLRDLELYPNLLRPWERICDSIDKPCIGYSTADNFCSNGTLTSTELAAPTVCVLHSRKEFIQEVKKYLD